MAFTENIKKELEDFARSDIESYKVLGGLDSTTCPHCGEMDGKVFPVAKAEIGANCPPFHDDCRCTITAHFDDMPHMGRSARDPLTKKSYRTEANNYTEWYASLTAEQKAAIEKQKGR